MRTTITYDGPSVRPKANEYGARLKVEAQRGKSGKVYTLTLHYYTGEPVRLGGFEADGQYVLSAYDMPKTIKAAIVEAIETEGPRIIEERADELADALRKHCGFEADRERRYIAELRENLAEAEARLAEMEARS